MEMSFNRFTDGPGQRGHPGPDLKARGSKRRLFSIRMEAPSVAAPTPSPLPLAPRSDQLPPLTAKASLRCNRCWSRLRQLLRPEYDRLFPLQSEVDGDQIICLQFHEVSANTTSSLSLSIRLPGMFEKF